MTPGDVWPQLERGMIIDLAPGVYQGPWEIDVPDVTILAEGATLSGPRDGSALVLAAAGITVRGLRIEDAGTVADLYAPDAAVWMVGCDGCRVEAVTTSGTPGGMRIEASRDVVVSSSALLGGPDGPGVTAYQADGLHLVNVTVDGFLDGVYLERSGAVTIRGVTITGCSAVRVAWHVRGGPERHGLGRGGRWGGFGSDVRSRRQPSLGIRSWATWDRSRTGCWCMKCRACRPAATRCPGTPWER